MDENGRSTSSESACAFSAVVPAAGLGARMGAKLRKPLLSLDCVPILLHTLWRLKAARGCRDVVVAVHPEDLSFYTPGRRAALREQFGVSEIAPGGETRQDSVLAALEATDSSAPLVLIHDAVRPLVRVDVVERVAARAAECGAALAAVPASATIKEAAPDGYVLRTPPREALWVAQTPQGFRRDVIIEAHSGARRDGFVGTDDALLVERIGHRVAIVEDNPENIKITTPADLTVAEAVLRWQKQQGYAVAELPPRWVEAFVGRGES